VVRVYVCSDLLDGTQIDPVGLKAVGRTAGNAYTRTVDGYIEMNRPGESTFALISGEGL
jgi:hypothetical protein